MKKIVYLSVKMEEKEKETLEKACQMVCDKEFRKYNLADWVRAVLLRESDGVLNKKEINQNE
jgi:hypothetical protein